MIILIPARGGSKRLPNKNIYPLNGKPLICYTLDAIAEADLNIPTYVSTDDEKIAAIVHTFPNVEVVMRPAEFASDKASTESVLFHLLDFLSKKGQSTDWLMTLPPTSPFRTAHTIRSFVEKAAACPDNIDSLMSVTENRGDFWCMQDDGSMQRLFPNAPRRQQDRLPIFEENSAVYLTRRQALVETGFILGQTVHGVSIPVIEGFDINNFDDIILAECMLDVIMKSTD